MDTKKGDFIEIVYVGELEDGTIFDLNDKEIANKKGINGHIHEKTVICLGRDDVVKGLDLFLTDKEIGKEFEVDLQPEDGFGKRNASLFQMIPMRKFNEQKIRPVPGLQLDIDGRRGIVKSVSGGRIMVDFNHPLAGKRLHYKVTITKKVEDTVEKIEGFLINTLHLHNAKAEEKEGVVKIKANVPEPLQKILEEELKKRVPELKELTFEK